MLGILFGQKKKQEMVKSREAILRQGAEDDMLKALRFASERIQRIQCGPSKSEKEENAIKAARSYLSGNQNAMTFRAMDDLSYLTEADKQSGPWEEKGFLLDSNRDGSYFLVKNSKGELRRAEPAMPGF